MSEAAIAELEGKCVCLVGSLPPPIGGVSTMCYNLSGLMARRGITVHVVDTTVSDAGSKRIPDGVYLHLLQSERWGIIRLFLFNPDMWLAFIRLGSLDQIIKIGRLGYVLRIIAAIKRIDRTTPIDIIHSFHALDRSYAALAAGHLIQKPVVVTTLVSEFTATPIFAKYKSIIEAVIKRASALGAISNYTSRVAARMTDRSDIAILYPGVDVHRFNPGYDVSPIVERHPQLRCKQMLLFVGWLIARKGPALILEAMTRLAAFDDLHCLIIGPDHGEKANLMKMTQDLGLEDRVTILDPVSEEDLPLYYAAADIFVFPTVETTEGFGIVAAEAMACETAVVASRIGAIPEVVEDGVTGFLFEPGNASQLAEKIGLLLSDQDLRQRMARRGRERVMANFTWEHTLLAYAKVSVECLKRWA